MKLLENKTIFVVEDDAANLAIISTLIRHHGGTVAYDRWGHDTIKRMKRRQQIDLILLDLMFPGDVTGYDIFDSIQLEETLCEIPVIAVTASDPDIEIPKVKAKGFKGFIPKPLHRHTFAQQLATVLDGEEVWIDELV